MTSRLFLTIGLFSLLACKTTSKNDCVQKAKQTDCVCITIYEPVCGCNNITYSNSCKAGCEGITQYTKGPCKE